MELPQQAFHITWNSQTQLEVASLTKIMTCMVVLRMLSESKGDLQETVEIGSVETNISGTTAEL
jgi:D-alanyl-D-alanine carboxypeptidase